MKPVTAVLVALVVLVGCSDPAAQRRKEVEAFTENLSTYCPAVYQYIAIYEANLGAYMLTPAADLFAAAKKYADGPLLPSDAPEGVAEAVKKAEDLGGLTEWKSVQAHGTACAEALGAAYEYRDSLPTPKP